MTQPTASVIVAVLNEAANIDHVLDTALSSSHTVECIVADGGSNDGTVESLRKRSLSDDRIVIVDNPLRNQAMGLNLAASRATGDVLVRLDGHTRYAPDYVDASLAAWRPSVAVGGPMLADGGKPWQAATANAMRDPLAIGPARFHHATSPESVDTVYLGAFSRSEFQEVDGYRAFRSGTVEDTDFYSRWRGAGKEVVVDPSIRCVYQPRETWAGLRVQYFRYGQGKAELLRLNKRLPTVRPLAPALLVLGLATTLVVGPVLSWIPALVLLVAWAGALTVVGARAPSNRLRTAAAAATMHIAYGCGFWAGLATRGPVVRES